jgi:hypothetical protein
MSSQQGKTSTIQSRNQSYFPVIRRNLKEVYQFNKKCKFFPKQFHGVE